MSRPSLYQVGVLCPSDLSLGAMYDHALEVMAPWDRDEFSPDRSGFFYEYINPLAVIDEGRIVVAGPLEVEWILERLAEVEEHAHRLTEFQREHIVGPAGDDAGRCIYGEFDVTPPPDDIEPLLEVPEAFYRFVTPDGEFHQRTSQMLLEPPVYKTFDEWWEEMRSFLVPLRESHVVVPTVLSAA